MRQRVGGLEPVHQRDGVAEDITDPLQLVRAGSIRSVHPLDAQVVAFARPQHQPVPVEGDGPCVGVGRACVDLQPHRRGQRSGRSAQRHSAAAQLLAIDRQELLALGELAGDLHVACTSTPPKMLATAASAASRPVPMRTRPFRWARRVASNTIQLPPMKTLEAGVEVRRIELVGIAGEVSRRDVQRAA